MFGIQENPNKPAIETTPQVNQVTTNDVTQDQAEAFISSGGTVDTGNSFFDDVMQGASDAFGEMGLTMGGGVSPMRAGGGSMPSGSAPQAFRGSTGNIAHILKMFSPYQGGIK